MNKINLTTSIITTFGIIGFALSNNDFLFLAIAFFINFMILNYEINKDKKSKLMSSFGIKITTIQLNIITALIITVILFIIGYYKSLFHFIIQ